MKEYSKKDALDLTVNVDSEDEKYVNIMNELWQKLQKTHRLRLVKKGIIGEDDLTTAVIWYL